MRKWFTLEDISTYRSELMGWAIIWIMMLHFTFTQIKPLGFVAQYGFAGVEIFLFVSGFGLFFSLDKNCSIKHFYLKRLLRIFPTYYILGIFASAFLYHDDLFTYLFRYTTIGFWTGGVYSEWYIPSIVLLYLIAPFLKKLFYRNGHIIIVLICVFCLLMAYTLVANNYITKGEPHFFLLYRIPAFLFGTECAYWLKKGIFDKYFYYILFAGIPIFISLFPHHHEIYNYKYFSLVFLLPLFTLIFIFISKTIYFINPVISTIGNASLEIYIIQGIFFHAILTEMIVIPVNYHDIVSFLLIILSSLLGIITHLLITKTGITRIH